MLESQVKAGSQTQDSMAKLRPRARIIRTIGDQLISGPEAALIELVKNAYDADSPSVLIRIAPPDKSQVGMISVSDRGHGMSASDVIEKWFEPATDEKLQRRTSPKGRRMLGAKGIGRFAASRLGRFTELVSYCSTKEGTVEGTYVEIDWEWFDSKKYLDQVEIPVAREILDSTAAAPGVQLTIRSLRDVWTKKRLETLIRELRRVVSPSETSASDFKIRLDLTAFQIAVHGFSGPELLTELNFATDVDDSDGDSDPFLIRPFGLQEHADYVLDGKFDKTGAFEGGFTIHRSDGVTHELSVAAPRLEVDEAKCGPFSVTINIYDREREAIEALFRRMGISIEKVGILAARKILTENAGIAIFRKGFRIRPYGEPENDWLELERQRVQNPSRKLGSTQVSGVVTIRDEDASGLVERSSREGLEHNGSFERLKHLIQNVLLHAEERRFEFREKAGLSRKSQGSLENVRKTASLRHTTIAAKRLPTKFRKMLEEAAQKDAAALAQELDEISEYQQVLQSRSALGLVVAEVIHEGRRLLNPIATSAKTLIDGKDTVLEDSKRGTVFRKQFPEHATTIYEGVRDLGRFFKRLDPISGRKRGRPTAFNVRGVISRCIDLFKDAISNSDIKVLISADSGVIAYGYEQDLQAALMNLIDNAVYWLSTVATDRVLEISVSHEAKDVLILVSNNGPLLDEAYVPRLFNAGFTLKAGGTGLGLAIAREAMRSSKGDVVFDDNAAETSFALRIPAAPGSK